MEPKFYLYFIYVILEVFKKDSKELLYFLFQLPCNLTKDLPFSLLVMSTLQR